MPQMAPISWVILLLIFILSLITFSTLNFFSTKYIPSSSSSKTSQATINLKW